MRTASAWCRIARLRRSRPTAYSLRKRKNAREPAPQRLTAQSVAHIVKNYANKVELDAEQYSGHSFRRGWLTAAARQKGADIFKMAEHSRHKSMDVLRGYIDDAQKNDCFVTIVRHSQRVFDDLGGSESRFDRGSASELSPWPVGWTTGKRRRVVDTLNLDPEFDLIRDRLIDALLAADLR